MTLYDPGGLRPTRTEYAEEQLQGQTPADPAWQPISDRITNWEIEGFGPEQIEKLGLGDVVADLVPGRESPSVTIGYDKQQWYVDNTGAPNALETYGIQRAAGAPIGSVTLVDRMESGDVLQSAYLHPASTIEHHYNGTAVDQVTRKASRIYTVMKGVHVGEPTESVDGDEEHWAVEASCPAEHGRVYQIDQPSAATTLIVASTDAADTGLHVTIEGDGAAPSETLQLDGADATTPVPGAQDFTTIDAIEVYEDDGGSPGDVADHAGDIIISTNDGAGAADEALAVLYGHDYYGNTAGDPGVPTLGGGSHAGEIGSDYFSFGNTGIYWPAGEPLLGAGDFSSLELSWSNETERMAKNRSREQRTYVGTMSPEVSVTHDGETEHIHTLKAKQGGVENDLVVEFDRAGNYAATLPRTKVTEAASGRESGSVNGELETTLRAQELATFTNAPQ